MRTIADYRQLNDALFHAGTNSGSLSEWRDEANSLHFYIISVQKNEDGVLSYELGVKSLEGSGPQKREFIVTPPETRKIRGNGGYVFFKIRNTGEPSAPEPSLHHQNTLRWMNSDIYRISVETEGQGCSAMLLNEFISLEPGEEKEIPVYVSLEKGGSRKARINLIVSSESDNSLAESSFLSIKSINRKVR